MEKATKMKLVLLPVLLAVCCVTAEARDLKSGKQVVYQPQTFPGAYGFLPNPGSGFPGVGFGLPSIGVPTFPGGTPLPSFGGVPGVPAGVIGGQP
ncbi:hypothetical protein HPP92_027794 [Vanilla planifolia]|uniref:Uncharacterized protein n=1 Tax=Vanilla planifolia TaxID=51239 RepID=A0A835PAG9_VANPL|nr:hypothetical protein HPP92_027794 [Vanilla planifolia]KAG0476667.1 hypothetical protein HPP92_013508 [Vanilla planifolia]